MRAEQPTRAGSPGEQPGAGAAAGAGTAGRGAAPEHARVECAAGGANHRSRRGHRKAELTARPGKDLRCRQHMVNWSRPIRLFDAVGARQSVSTVPTNPGVYRIRILNIDGQPIPVRRLGGDDPDGILDIGETGKGSGNLQYRIQTFQQAALKGKAPHSAGWNFYEFGYVHLFRLDSLYVDWVVTPTKEAARILEGRLLKDHRRRFLDLPPLNSKA